MTTFIETERLMMRKHRASDLRKLHRWQNDVELLSFNSSTISLQSLRSTAGQLRRWIEADDDAFVRVAVDHKATGSFIGFAQFAFVDRVNLNCKVGLTIGEKEFWNRGLGAELLSGLADFGFTHLGLHRMTGEVYETNTRAVRTFEKVRFVREGVLRDTLLRDNRWVNEIVFGLIAKDWFAARSQ